MYKVNIQQKYYIGTFKNFESWDLLSTQVTVH